MSTQEDIDHMEIFKGSHALNFLVVSTLFNSEWQQDISPT